MRTTSLRTFSLAGAVSCVLTLVVVLLPGSAVAADPTTSRPAAAAPTASGPVSLGPLEKLKSTPQTERLRMEVGRLKDPAVVPALIEALKSTDRAFRASAAGALGWSGDPRALEPLREALRDPDPWMRQRAAEALGRLRDTRAVEALAAALGDADRGVRTLAATALGSIGDRSAAGALASLIERVIVGFSPGEALQPPPPAPEGMLVAFQAQPAIAAAVALQSMNEPRGRETLIRLLREGTSAQRESAANLIMQVPDPSLATPLIELLRHPDPAVRRLSAASLAYRMTPEAVDPLAVALGDPDVTVRRVAAAALSGARDRQGAAAPRAGDSLIAALGDPDPVVRETAVSALRTLGERRAAKPIAALLRDPESRVRMIAAMVVGLFRFTEAADALRGALEDPDATVRDAAKQSLRMIGVEPPPPPPRASVAKPLRARDFSALLRAVSAALASSPEVSVSTVGVGSAEARVLRQAVIFRGRSASIAALEGFTGALGKSPTLTGVMLLSGKPVTGDTAGPLTFLVSGSLVELASGPAFSPLPPNKGIRREIGRASEAAGLGMLQLSPGGIPPQPPGAPAREVLLIEAGGELQKLIRFFDSLATLPELEFAEMGISNVMREGGGRPGSVFTATCSATIPVEVRR